MRPPFEKAEAVLKILVDGCSVSMVERVTGVHHGTILKLLVLAGERREKITSPIRPQPEGRPHSDGRSVVLTSAKNKSASAPPTMRTSGTATRSWQSSVRQSAASMSPSASATSLRQMHSSRRPRRGSTGPTSTGHDRWISVLQNRRTRQIRRLRGFRDVDQGLPLPE